jgi:hypothetical protein
MPLSGYSEKQAIQSKAELLHVSTIGSSHCHASIMRYFLIMIVEPRKRVSFRLFHNSLRMYTIVKFKIYVNI